MWWDPAATGPDEIRKDGTGMWTFVDGGQRYLPGEWPTDVQAVRSGGRRDDLRRPTAGGDPARLPQPRRLTRDAPAS